MDETRFGALPGALGVSTDRRGTVRTAAAGAVLLAALAAGNTAAKKNKKKAPAPLAFVAIATTGAESSGGDNPVVNWEVNGTFFHPAGGLQGGVSGTFQSGFGPTPNTMRAQLSASIQAAVADTLEANGEIVDPKRISITIL